MPDKSCFIDNLEAFDLVFSTNFIEKYYRLLTSYRSDINQLAESIILEKCKI